MGAMRVAVVIPTLNEEAGLPRVLDALKESGDWPESVTVADCGSEDATLGVARQWGVHVVTGEALTSRATAMNAGAREAVVRNPEVDVLWFLHADTRVRPGWREAIAETLGVEARGTSDARHAESLGTGGGRGVVGGAFTHRFDLEGVDKWWDRRTLKTVSFFNRGRYRLTGSFFGDQGLFIRREAFERVGGYDEGLRLLEDLDLCRRLRRLGPVRLANDGARVITSPRRFLRHGILRQAMLDCAMLTGFNLGVRPAWLYRWYNRHKE